MSLVAASLDYAGIGSVIAAFTATVALVFGYRNTRRAQQTTESVSYVDNNLKTMQATLDWLTADNGRLREINEQQRLQIIGFDEELQRVEDEAHRESLRQSRKISELNARLEEQERELTQCKELCATINSQLTEKRKQDEPNDERVDGGTSS